MPPSHFHTKTRQVSSPGGSDNSLSVVDLGNEELLNVKDEGDSMEYLHLLVDDLRHEVAVLRTQLEESDLECSLLKAELKTVKESDRNKVQQLVDTLSRVSQSKVSMTNVQMEALSAEEASNLTIATLSRKVEQLCIMNSVLVDDKITLGEKVQELEGENEAKQLKIDALELQFKAINKTRQKAVQRLTNKDRSNSSFSSTGSGSRNGRVD